MKLNYYIQFRPLDGAYKLTNYHRNGCYVSYNRDLLVAVIKIHTPQGKPWDDRDRVWFTKPLIQLIKGKARHDSDFKRYKNLRDKLTFNLLRKRYDLSIKDCYKVSKKNRSNMYTYVYKSEIYMDFFKTIIVKQ